MTTSLAGLIAMAQAGREPSEPTPCTAGIPLVEVSGRCVQCGAHDNERCKYEQSLRAREATNDR